MPPPHDAADYMCTQCAFGTRSTWTARRSSVLGYDVPVPSRMVLVPGPSPTQSHRDGRLLVLRLDHDAVRQANRAIHTINCLTRTKNPGAIPAPKVKEIVSVYDIDTRSCHLVLVHPVDYRLPLANPIGNVVVFSEPAYAPCRAPNLQLCTPAHYRDEKDLKPGIRDRRDGALTKDGTPWASSITGGTVRAELSFVSSSEPWVYCAAHYRDDTELRRLRREFAVEYGYMAATRIEELDSFATRLGVDFALGLDKSGDVSLGPIEKIAYTHSRYTFDQWDASGPIDTFVHVYHGPVHYEDRSGSIEVQNQWFDPHCGPRAWFTKRTRFERQSEYRFAVSALGDPVKQKHYVAASPELRALTSAL